MADDADWAAGIAEADREGALARHGRGPRATATDPGPDCMSCGDPISEGRRRALPATCLCTECQERFERSLTRR